jgi:hypothetical protein
MVNQQNTLIFATWVTFVILGALSLSGCAPFASQSKLFPDKLMSTTIDELNGMAGQKDFVKSHKDGVRIKGFVVSRHRGGPLDKEILGLSSKKPQLSKTDYSEVKPTVYCGREIPPSEKPVNVGDEITVGGFVYRSSAPDNIFLESCLILPDI